MGKAIKAWGLGIKRGLDMVISSLALLLLSPLLLAIALLVRITSGAPVLFRQPRPGLHGKVFSICKFRTMLDLRDAQGKLLPREQRVTRLGRLLRSTSLDELPELWNVLRGEMSIVGPRPLLVQYLERYSPEQARRHDMRPGITGWAQVRGRNALGWEERFAMDVYYIDHWSLALDLRILVMTVWQVFKREGIDEAGGVGMSEWMGTGGRA